MFIFFIFKETSIMRHFRSFCHIINYVTLRLYDNFPIFQTCHIKEVKQYRNLKSHKGMGALLKRLHLETCRGLLGSTLQWIWSEHRHPRIVYWVRTARAGLRLFGVPHWKGRNGKIECERSKMSSMHINSPLCSWPALIPKFVAYCNLLSILLMHFFSCVIGTWHGGPVVMVDQGIATV